MPIHPIVIVGVPRSAIDQVIEQHGCRYVADLSRHESVEQPNSYPLADPSLGGTPPGLSPAEPPQFGDRDMILFSLRKADSHKVISRMATPFLTRWGRTGTVKFDPYPLLGKEIIKRIAKAEAEQ
jgi:hypothetical protein